MCIHGNDKGAEGFDFEYPYCFRHAEFVEPVYIWDLLYSVCGEGSGAAGVCGIDGMVFLEGVLCFVSHAAFSDDEGDVEFFEEAVFEDFHAAAGGGSC